MAATITLKNKRLKMSPGGLVSLPVCARKALGMAVGKGALVTISGQGKDVVISPATGKPESAVRVSPKGTLELPAGAATQLRSTPTRHYWLEAFDGERRVVLHPFG